jgi:hypothetical protein
LFGDFWKEKVLASFILRSLSLEILWNNSSLMSYMIIFLPLYVCIYIYIFQYTTVIVHIPEKFIILEGGRGGVNPYILQEYIVSHNLSQCEVIVS